MRRGDSARHVESASSASTAYKGVGSRSTFRPDINGLRAIAVIAVVLFHFKAPLMSGGFVGVDIFFVVSGYLMTKIITNGLETDRFSLWRFYAARIRRIVPALLGLCAVLLAIGALWIDPEAYRLLGRTVVTALLFVSNVQFWREAGYFDQSNELTWLLHTWSLATEWHFYMIYPLALMAVYRFSMLQRRLVSLLWAAALLSFAMNIVLVSRFPGASFYLLPTRAWEMLAGGIVAVQFDRAPAGYGRILHLLGLLMIGLSVAIFSENWLWPSYGALLPVLGTACVIAARRVDSVLTGNLLFQLLGSWSYATYIWHWPIVVGIAYFEFPDSFGIKLLALVMVIGAGGPAVSVIARMASGVFLAERRRSNTNAALGLILASVVVAAAAASVVLTGGLSVRAGSHRAQLADYEAAMTDWVYPDECRGLDRSGDLLHCSVGAKGHLDTLIIGDSHAEQIYPRALVLAQAHPDSSFAFVTMDGCVPMLGVGGAAAGSICKSFVEKAFEAAQTWHYKHLVVEALWYLSFTKSAGEICFVEGSGCVVETDEAGFETRTDAVFSRMETLLRQIKQQGVDVTILLPTPFGKYDIPAELIKRTFLHKDTSNILTLDRNHMFDRYTNIRHRLVALATGSGASVVDPIEFLCSDERCPTVDAEGHPLYRDSNHFRSSVVASNRFQFLDRILLPASDALRIE